MIAPPRVTLESLLHRPLNVIQDVTQWLSDWQYVQSNQFNGDLVVSPLRAALDKDQNGTLDRVDRDYWLDQWLKKYLPPNPRLPWTEDAGSPASDPLLLTVNPDPGEQFLIIDPASRSAVVVVRGTNNCTLQDGTADGSLFDTDPQVYRRTLLRDFDCLDETHFGSVIINATVRRFPYSANQKVTVYVRGGTQMLSKEIHLRRNDNISWNHLTQLVIRNYPGERPVVHIGSSKIVAGEPHDFYVNKYRFLPSFQCERHSLVWRGIKWIGYRVDGATRIFCPKLWRYDPPFDGTLRADNSEWLDIKGISPTSGDAGAYPDWVDAQFENRVRTETVLNKNDMATPGAGSTTLTSASGGFLSSHVGYHVRIVSGTNFSAGNYRIAAFVSGTQVTLDTSPTPSGAGSSGVGTVDGIFLSKTDLATPGAGSFTLTSASGGFTSGMVNYAVRITSGTNFVVGWYRIAAFVSSTQVTLGSGTGEVSPTPSGAGSAGVGFIGGVDYGTGLGDNDVQFVIHLAYPNCLVEESHIRFAAETAPPYPDPFVGDGVRSADTGIILRRCLIDGVTPHSAVATTGANLTVEYCDVQNVDNSCIGASGDGAIIQYNRLHKYGQRVATSHNALQLQGAANSIVRGNVIFDPGLTEDGWGLALFADTTLNENLENCEISYNIVYACGTTLNHTGGVEELRVKNNKVHHNVFIDTSPGNAAISGGQRDAPLYLLIGDGEANAAYGNAIYSNLIGRLDASDNMMVTFATGPGYRYYDVDEFYPLWVGNFTADPKFQEPAKGNFALLEGSPVADWFDENVPLSPNQSAEFYNAIDALFT